jgi:hypothetical protein
VSQSPAPQPIPLRFVLSEAADNASTEGQTVGRTTLAATAVAVDWDLSSSPATRERGALQAVHGGGSAQHRVRVKGEKGDRSAAQPAAG